MDFPFLADTMSQLLAATPTTLALWISAIAIGGVLAIFIAWARVSGVPGLSQLAGAYIFVFRGSPLLIQTFLLYYGLSQFAGVRQSFVWPILRDPFNSAVISLALCTAGYTAEIWRGGLMAVPGREIEAGRAIGMSGLTLFRRIIAPIALRQALPAYSTEIVLMMKSTALASLVTVWEVTGVAERIIAQTYRTFEVFICAAVIYLVLNFLIIRVLLLIERRISPHLRARPKPIVPGAPPAHAAGPIQLPEVPR
ncbi:MAG TPA: ABC transporter permease [Devosiaceae bacterium]|jgi:octopine/nopaline transport system permease protein|nr:ABC transporter permease [Devosiaceae bacterium]